MKAILKCALFATAICLATSPGALWAAGKRVSEGLQVLYDFGEPSGDIVHDRSGIGKPLNLRIAGPSSARWRNGALMIGSSTVISSTAPATKLANALRDSGALTIEAWIKPYSDSQRGPARIVTLSAGTIDRNFTLGQDGARYDVRLRTRATSDNGLPSTPTFEGAARTELTHVVYTRDAAGQAILYIGGRKEAAKKVGGDLSNWRRDYRLHLANEATGDRPWLGELRLVAIYNRAISEAEVKQNFAAGVHPPVDYASLLPVAAARPIDFVKDVQPILRQRCFECHAEGNEEGGLNLGIRARVLEGGKGGPVLTPGDSASSRLIHLVVGLEEETVMPPEGERLTKEQIGVIRAWIDQGAAWPEGADVLDARTERGREHWAFQPLRPVTPPTVADKAWCRTPIDRFVLAALETKGLIPAAPADARTFVRRAYFDMLGLPPAPEEVATWTSRLGSGMLPNFNAAQQLADELLGSRHYGERWGRHWLDVARYADSDGQERDNDRPEAYHYRDFVIRALNDDMPFDQFVRWQLAGDEYAPDDPAAVAATGFLVAGPNTVLENSFLEEERLRNRYNELDDMLSTVGVGMLGLTIGCARCHDHKYDAISAREYYRMLSAFHSGDRKVVKLPQSEDKTLAFADFGGQRLPTWLFDRGDFYDRDQEVQLGFLAVLMRGKTSEDFWKEAQRDPPQSGTTYQRKALAAWMTNVQHGAGALAARVIVNRVWRHHFGEGLVRTVNDFGVRGEAPANPDFLEWLAHDFATHGWRLKRLHRLILTSAVYQQSAEMDPVKARADPENRLWGQVRPRRLEAEALRDAILAVSGTLNREPYGPAFKPPISLEAMIARNLKSPYPQDAQDMPATRRRSIYMFHKRVIPYPLLQVFDRPDSLQSCGRRETTTVAPQALALLNDPFVRTRAFDFADRLLAEARDDDRRLIERAYWLALSRSPTESETAACREFIDAQARQRQSREPKIAAAEIRRQAVADFGQTLFLLNEFIYID